MPRMLSMQQFPSYTEECKETVYEVQGNSRLLISDLVNCLTTVSNYHHMQCWNYYVSV